MKELATVTRKEGVMYIDNHKVYGVDIDRYIYLDIEKNEYGANKSYKLYSYPNGDIAIFYKDRKVVIANDMEFYNEYKRLVPKDNSGCMPLIIAAIIASSILFFL